MKRPGLEVRARKGFLPPDVEAIERAREEEVTAGVSPALTAALGKPVPVGGLPFRVSAASLRGADNNGSVLVTLEIDGPSLRFEERDGLFVESVEVSVVAADARGQVQDGEDNTFSMNLSPETHKQVIGSGVRLMSQLTLSPGRYQIRVGAHESTGGTTGTVPYDLVVPDYEEMPFALSGVLLTSSAAGRFATGNDESAWTGLLPSPPVVTRTFSASETLTWFAEVYDASSRAPHVINYTSTVRDASDGRTLVQAEDSRTVEAGTERLGHGFTTSYPLRDLVPGMYVLRVDATSTVGDYSARHEILFEVQ